MEQSKAQFRSATGLDHDSRLQVNAFNARKAGNISSCDSINLAPISLFESNSTTGDTKQHKSNQRGYLECPGQERNDTMKIRRSKKSKVKEAKKRPHFRIDWRQLSYYQRPHSFLSKCLANLDIFSPSNSKTVDERMKSNQISDRSEASSLMAKLPSIDNDTDNNGGPRQILNSLDGCFKSGELSAILGPSGAGKSTFLSTLFGAKQESAFGYTKVTWLNGPDNSQQVTAANELNDEQHRSLRIAFLPQHDHLLHHLTVYETLMFASKIKSHELVERQTEAAKAKEGTEKRLNFHHMNVKRVAKMLKLTECLNTRCGKLSGGQYKRVSIGQELLSEPDVIILDEPTSGLDAMTCLTTIQTLKSIVTKHPMSIILTIHQPDNDVFSLFDKVYVIAQGGLAIYEGPPDGIFATMAKVNLFPPRANYNPARFIVENAFVPEPGAQDHLIGLEVDKQLNGGGAKTVVSSSSSDDEDDDEDGDSSSDDCQVIEDKAQANYFKRSMQSLTDTIMGKETPFVRGSPFRRRDTIKRPLLNIGIRTLDGQLITSEQLASLKQTDAFNEQQQERLELLRRLNQMQKANYDEQPGSGQGTILSSRTSNKRTSLASSRNCSSTDCSPSPNSSKQDQQSASTESRDSKSTSAKSDYSSASACSMMMMMVAPDHQKSTTAGQHQVSFSPDADYSRAPPAKSVSMACLPAGQCSPTNSDGSAAKQASNSLEAGLLHIDTRRTNNPEEPERKVMDEFVVDFGADLMAPDRSESCSPMGPKKLRRKFDKRLSAKHNCSQQTGYPILYHALLLTHRTWLSIVRDPIFFGIQACMHTLIPIVLATIFGSVQDEGCPRIGNFDLVDFAYSDSENLIQGTVRSIRQSIGNIGIVFFEMFVICFAINCITALVFPLDMYVLLKEYRNGWYSLRSYFMGRTLADLPVPVVLHSIGMAILYFMTGQPHSMWRFGSIVLLVILASLVAQSVGLTIGALLMKSSQSAVLAAAGIVAPFFALSGFIVRIHTLPLVAQVAANLSYLYHLLNGFIILRYGFGRCKCSEEDFEQNSAHQIPGNLHTMASMWIGTYSDEYANSTSVLAAATNQHHSNRSNIDPNIDVVDKMMTAFRMANSYGHQIDDCNDVLPYAMLDFNQRDQDLYYCFFALAIMVLVTRLITFAAIYYKIRSFS